jgi:ribulose bisphosphate carboxylase small subunit
MERELIRIDKCRECHTVHYIGVRRYTVSVVDLIRSDSGVRYFFQRGFKIGKDYLESLRRAWRRYRGSPPNCTEQPESRA